MTTAHGLSGPKQPDLCPCTLSQFLLSHQNASQSVISRVKSLLPLYFLTPGGIMSYQEKLISAVLDKVPEKNSQIF
jgi:hypothetical protein